MFDLSRSVGPLPLWAWVVVGAIAAFLVWRRRNESGWFPTSSTGVQGEPSPARMTFRAAIANAVQGKPTSDEDEDEREIKLTISALGRDQMPTAIIQGGADGTVERYFGGSVLAEPLPSVTPEPTARLNEPSSDHAPVNGHVPNLI